MNLEELKNEMKMIQQELYIISRFSLDINRIEYLEMKTENILTYILWCELIGIKDTNNG